MADSIYSEQQYRIHFQSIRQVFVRVNWLDFNTEYITDVSTGICVDGGVNISVDASNRRTMTLKMVLTDDSYLVNPNGHVWLNRKFSANFGIKDIITDEIVYFPSIGTFIVDQPSLQLSNTTRELSITGSDMMSFFDGSFSGALMTQLQLDVGIPLSEAIRLLFSQHGGVTKFNIDTDSIVDDDGNPLLIPYQIKKIETDTVYDTAKELVNLYMGYELFFDITGTLVYRKIRNKINDPVVFTFDTTDTENRNLAINIEQKFNFHNVRNYIEVFGKSITPLVATPSTDYKEENTATKLIVYYNRPLYNSNNQPFSDGTDMKSYFTYSGTQSNYISATYNITTGYTVTFIITGEQGESLTPIPNIIYNSCAVNYYDDKYEFCSTDQLRWSVPNYITIDYTNNTIVKLVIKFNKPLYDSSGTKLVTDADVKSYFSYSGDSANFTSATYTTDDYNNEITFIFTTDIDIGDTLDIVSNTIYDSAGFTIDITKWTYIFNGTEWYLKTSEVTSENQIQAIAQNNIEGDQFSIQAITQRNLAIKDTNIFTIAQAQSRADYELWNHSNLAETITITCVPIFMLDVNQLIYVRDDRIGVDGKYCITQISLPLKYNGSMSISAYKVYNQQII